MASRAAATVASSSYDQPVWSNLKRSLANLTKHSIGELTALVKTRLRRMQDRPGLLDGFLAKTGLDLTLR
jgi:putative transposase